MGLLTNILENNEKQKTHVLIIICIIHEEFFYASLFKLPSLHYSGQIQDGSLAGIFICSEIRRRKRRIRSLVSIHMYVYVTICLKILPSLFKYVQMLTLAPGGRQRIE